MQEGKRRKRRSSAPLPGIHNFLDLVMLVLLSAVSVAGIWLYGGVHLWSMASMTLAVMLAGMAFYYRFFISRYRHDLVVPPGGFMLLILLGYLAAILGFADIPHDARMETFRYISYAVAFWAWVNLTRGNQRWQAILIVLMLSVSVMAWYSLIQDVHGSNMVLHRIRPAQYGMRASGAYICPNHFANLLEMMIPLCLAVAACRGVGLPIRLIAGYTALISLPPVYLSESRSGWIGLMAGLTVLALSVALRRGVKKFILVLVLAPLLAGGAGYAAWTLSPRVQQRVELALQGDIRLTLWKDTVEVIKESPLIGSGLGSYRWVFAHVRTHFYFNNDPEYAHNDYLHLWAEIGIIGLVLLGLMVVMILIRSVRVLLRGREDRDVYLIAGMMGAMSGALVHAFFDFNFHVFANAHVYIMLIGIITGATVDESRFDRLIVTASNRIRWMGITLMLVTAGLAAVYAKDVYSRIITNTAMAGIEKMEWDKSSREFQKAIRWSPDNWRAHIGMAHLLRSRSFWVRDPQLKSEWIRTSRYHYEQALRLNPWEADSYYGLSGLAKQEGDKESALKYRRLTVERVPRHTFYLNELGLQLREMGMYQEAYEAFRQSQGVAQTTVAEKNIAWLKQKGLVTP